MVVVSIIGIMAAGIAPAITSALADGRAANAAVDLVRIGGRARSEATFTGLAHCLTYTAGQNGGFGQVQLYRGVNNRCNMQNWGGALIDSVVLAQYNYGNTHVINVQPSAGNQAQIDICYQPDGAMLVRFGGGGNFAPPATNGVAFTVTRTVNGGAGGVARQVFFPYGGTARLDR
jgi:Tfp pilus assembly protein FimT